MIIQLQGATAENTAAARNSLEALARSWGQEITETPAETTAAASSSDDDHGKIIDPFSLAALILSIPPAALAVLDLADRILKRHRASELISHAQQQAAQHVTLTLITRTRTIELRTLTPDQLLDLLDSEDPAS
jgi:hypothetical protein